MTSWRQVEEKSKKFIFDLGYDVVLRTDRSHGIFDLIGVRTTAPYKPVLFVQLKTSKKNEISISVDEKNNLIQLCQNLPQFVRFKVLFVWGFDTILEEHEFRDISYIHGKNKPMKYWSDYWK